MYNPASDANKHPEKAHSTHSGIEATPCRARKLIFWPGLNTQVKDLVSRWEVCQAAGKEQAKELLSPQSMPERPLQVVCTDIFQLGDFHFLILVDYWNSFWELDQLSDVTSTTVILHLRWQFARYGIPDKLVSRNGLQFSCQ